MMILKYIGGDVFGAYLIKNEFYEAYADENNDIFIFDEFNNKISKKSMSVDGIYVTKRELRNCFKKVVQ